MNLKIILKTFYTWWRCEMQYLYIIIKAFTPEASYYGYTKIVGVEMTVKDTNQFMKTENRTEWWNQSAEKFLLCSWKSV
jgi:hypothetical protein